MISRLFALCAALFALLASSEIIAMASDANWSLDRANSRLFISGSHAGRPFSGALSDYSATISFDGTNPTSISITLDMKGESYKTGSSLYDGTLQGAEWLDTGKYPSIQFISSAVLVEGEGFILEGALRFKGKTHQMRFPFTFEATGTQAVARGTFNLNRKTLDIGMQSDPTADWVSADLKLDFTITAVPAG